MGYTNPKASQWPLQVQLNGYTQIARKVAELSSTAGHGLQVIVNTTIPQELELFEQHAQELFKDQNYPPTAGYSEFGFGVYGTDPKLSNYSDKRFHDRFGNSIVGYDSPYKGLVIPFLQHSNAFTNPNLLLMNLHQKQFRARILDSIITCSNEAKANDPTKEPKCVVVSDFTEIFVKPGPSGVVFTPIYPEEDPAQIVGFIGASIHWQEVLTNVVPDYVDGLYCVISTDTGHSNTYIIQGGQPELVGEGDLHDTAYERYGHSVVLNDEESNASASVRYTLTVYPSQAMLHEFRTGVPLYVSIAFVLVILVCTIIFFVYDYFIRSQSQERKRILELKRKFVRFVSHEIRTPLNVVCMGLDLLQREIRSTIDREQKEGLQQNAQFEKDMTDKSNSLPPLLHAKANEPISSSSSSSSLSSVSRRDADKLEDTAKRRGRLPGQDQYWLDLTTDILENTQVRCSSTVTLFYSKSSICSRLTH